MDDKEDIKAAIEQLVSQYCDGTWNGLEGAHFIEWFGDTSSRGPQELADRLVDLFKELSNGR
jgi:hypothetical protein